MTSGVTGPGVGSAGGGFRLKAVARACATLLALTTAAVSRAADLPVATNAAGAVVFGDSRLRVVFSPTSGCPDSVWAGESCVLVRAEDVSVPFAFRHLLTSRNADQPQSAGFSRIASDILRSDFTCGGWRVEGYFQLFPRELMVRRWFAFTWTGKDRVTFDGISFSHGRLKCAEGRGAYLLPNVWPPSRKRRTDWKAGSLVKAAPDAETPLLAENGNGWSVALLYDRLRPYSDSAQHRLVEQADGLSLWTWVSACGYAQPGQTQLLGDDWLVLRKGGVEDALDRIHAWHRQVGHLPPADRPDWVRRLVLYSTHPRGLSGTENFTVARSYLPFVRALGSDAIWLRPVEHAGGYRPDELYRLQDGIGSDDDHLDYVRDAHALGLKVWHDAVMHGGRTSNRRTREHPEWVCRKQDGSFQDTYWAYDFNWPSWVQYFSDFVEWTTRKYELDGWRMDVPTGSRFPNWNPQVPYARASYARNQGGLAQMRAVRAAMKRINPDSCTLAEANGSHCSVLCDSIYDQLLCHSHFHRFNAEPAEKIVRELSQWLADQRKAFVPGTIWMRYPESHDSYPCDHIWGRAAANALMALSAWIEGFPLVKDGSEDGAFETYREIFRIRRALAELNDGEPDYLSVKAPPGVFACRRDNGKTASVFYINFNEREIEVGGLRLAPFGFAVKRVKGPSLERELAGLDRSAYAPLRSEGPQSPLVEVLDPNGARRTDVIVECREVAEGVSYRISDFGGNRPSDLRLVVRLPPCGRWYAHAADGSYESPYLVRHPLAERYFYQSEAFDAAVRWDSTYHPFGFTREHAAVGGVAGADAYECFGFGDGSVVRLVDRIGTEKCLAVQVSGETKDALALTWAKRPTEAALAPRPAGTGDARLRAAMGGWLFETGKMRVRLRRTGALVGVWARAADGSWERVLGSLGVWARSPKAPKEPRINWTGQDDDVVEQAFSPLPHATFRRAVDGEIELAFLPGNLSSIQKNSPKIEGRGLHCQTRYSFRDEASFGLTTGFCARSKFGKDDWTLAIRAELPSGRRLEDVVLDQVSCGRGWQDEVRADGFVGWMYHRAGGTDFVPVAGQLNGFSARISVAGGRSRER